MAATRPTGEQLRFQSAKTGDHVLDTYLETAEQGNRTLGQMMSDLWDSDDGGNLRSSLWELRVNSSTYKLQQRVGTFSDPEDGWTDVANTSIFRYRGTHADATAYLVLDLVEYSGTIYMCTVAHTSTSAVPNGSNFETLVSIAAAGVDTFNGRSGTVLLTSGDVTTALGFTPPTTAYVDAQRDTRAALTGATFTGTVNFDDGGANGSVSITVSASASNSGSIDFKNGAGTALAKIYADGTNLFFNVLGGLTSVDFNQTPTVSGTAVSLVGHTHAISDVTNLTTELNGKAPLSHSHAISHVTNLQTTLDGKAALSHTHTTSDITNLATYTGFDSRYYTESEVNTLLAGKVPLDGTGATGTWDINITGTVTSAATAEALATPRNIALGGDLTGSANFDGSANITITATVVDDSHNHVIANVDGLQTALDAKQNLDGDLTAIAALAGTTGLLKKTALNTWTLDTTAYTPTNGTGATGTWAISITGSAATLTTARNISLGGDLSGSASFDGSSNITITATVADDSHNHIVSNVDGLQTALDAKAPLASPAFTGTPTTGGIEIGYRAIPRSTTTTTATTGDVGKCIAVTAGMTIPASTFAAGDAVSIYNNSASSVTITQSSGLTLRLAGTSDTGNRTLAARGMATIWFNSATEAIITGAGVS